MTENNDTSSSQNGKGNGIPDALKLTFIVISIIVLIGVIYFTCASIIGANKTYSPIVSSSPDTKNTPAITVSSDKMTSSENTAANTTEKPTLVPTKETTATISSTVATTQKTLETTVKTVATTQKIPETTVKTIATTSPNNKAVIFIDPGHGGTDPGTSGKLGDTTYYEKDINLSVSLLIGKELEKMGFKVAFSRTTDATVDLNSRVPAAEEAKADMFLSIHCNSFVGSGRAYGPIIIYTDRTVEYEKNKFAAIFSGNFDKLRSSYPAMRASRIRGDFELNNYYLAVLCSKKMPSLLIELGFMTDESDLKMLTSPSWQSDIAKAIARSVADAYNAGFAG